VGGGGVVGDRTGEAGAIDIYVENNRVAAMPSDGDAVATAVAMWDRYEAEGETFAVFSTSNDTVRDLNAAIQRHRGQRGLVSGKGMAQGRHQKLGVGDHIVTRQNDRGLVTDRGHWVRNRETFTITKITKTSIVVTGSTGTVELPAEYVKDNVDLAYAQTSHAGQGRTVDHSLLMIAEDDTPGRAGINVPMTRGRKTNRAVVATGTENPDASNAAEIITEALARRWIDSPAIGEMADTPTEQRAAARAALDQVTGMAKRNRAHLRRRNHPLHFARKQRLTARYNELFDVLTKSGATPKTDRRPSNAPERGDDVDFGL